MDISVIIPARNEIFLSGTIEKILSAIRADTEIIAILDGCWTEPPVKDNERVVLIHHTEPIGQRAAVNEATNLSQAKYILKTDGHSMLDEGFDVKLMADCEPDWTVIPRMYNLHVFDWKCKNDHRFYQDSYSLDKENLCPNCKEKLEISYVWQPRKNRRTDYMYMDKDLRVQYYRSRENPHESNELIDDVMNGQGACWFQERKRFLELGGLDEKHGFWGQVGTEIACKAWLSGGRQVVNKKTWFAHMFRTTGTFSFPYKIHGSDQEKARQYSRDLWLNNKWPLQKRKFQWLLDKFAPVPSWGEKESISIQKPPTKGMVYYTDNLANEYILNACRNNLDKVRNGSPLVCVSLLPVNFGDKNIVLNLQRCRLTMFKEILAGLEVIDTDIVFLTEHDILYHPSHFDFVPPKDDVFYYNVNTWKLREEDGQALFYYTKQTSGLCAYRNLLLEHYRKRVERVEKTGYDHNMGYEPGCHHLPLGVDNYNTETWESEYPNVDIRHGNNLTANRFRQDQFRNERSCRGWKLADEIPYWGKTKNRFSEFIKEFINGYIK